MKEIEVVTGDLHLMHKAFESQLNIADGSIIIFAESAINYNSAKRYAEMLISVNTERIIIFTQCTYLVASLNFLENSLKDSTKEKVKDIAFKYYLLSEDGDNMDKTDNLNDIFTRWAEPLREIAYTEWR